MPPFPKPDLARPATCRHAESRPPKRERLPRVWAGREVSDASPHYARPQMHLIDLKRSFPDARALPSRSSDWTVNGAGPLRRPLSNWLSAPFWAGATHGVHPRPAAVTDVRDQVVKEGGEVGGWLSGVASKPWQCGHFCDSHLWTPPVGARPIGITPRA